MKNLRVLYVDDSLMARKIVGEFLEEYVESVDLAEDGEDAIELFEAGKYDLVVTDIKMPNKDGMSLIAEIREIDPAIKVVVISAYKGDKERAECNTLKVDEFLEKPLDLELLSTVLGKISSELTR